MNPTLKAKITASLILFSSIYCLSQSEYTITATDTLHSRIMINGEGEHIDIYFATPDKYAIPKDKMRNHFMLHHFQIDQNGQLDSISSEMLLDEKIQKRSSNIINLDAISLKKKKEQPNSLQLFEEENEFSKWNFHKVPFQINQLSIKGKGLGGFKPPFNVVDEIFTFDDESKRDKAKNEVDFGEISKNEFWVKMGEVHSKSQNFGRVLGVFGKKVKKDKTKKWNDLQDFKFVLFNEEGKIQNEQEVKVDRSYLVSNTGLIHGSQGDVVGYFIGYTEAGGMGYYKKANEEWLPENQMITIIDLEGNIVSNDIYKIPYKFNTLTHQDVKAIALVKRTDSEYRAIFKVPALMKQKVKAGLVVFSKENETTTLTQELPYETIRNKTIEGQKSAPGEYVEFLNFDLSIPIKDGGIILAGSSDGAFLNTLFLDKEGNVESYHTSSLAQPFRDGNKNLTRKETLSNGNVLLTIQVANRYRSFAQYALVDLSNGNTEILRTSKNVNWGKTARFEDQILFYGIDDENNQKLHFKLLDLK